MSDALDVHVVPHTHWDREWYHAAGRFRQRLVALVDELLDARSAPDHFLLDGQAVVLDDYLDARPGQRDALVAALGGGRLEAGPWYVLADELIPCGESLVRNLLAGRRALARLGATPPPVLYSPDAFGHTAAMPLLAAGFGYEVTVVWRGYGGARWPAGDAAWWVGPDGSRVLLYHLPPDGYEYGSTLPTDPRASADRWARMRAVLAPRAVLGLTLVQNGADHHAPQRGLAESVATLRIVAAPDRVVVGSLAAFAREARARADGSELPAVRGELRDSYGYAWTLQGTLASRASQKRRNAHVERLLLRDVESWIALVALRDRALVPATRDLLQAAWRTLLLCHPHDTLCGCSSDEVARAADARFDDAATQGRGLRDDALAVLAGHDPDGARALRSDWRPCLVVRNRSVRPRGGVAEAEILTFVRDVAVGPASAGAWRPVASASVTARVADGPTLLLTQVLDRGLRHDRVEAPRHYPDDDLVDAARALVWVPVQEGLSMRAYPIGGPPDRVASAVGPTHAVLAGDATVDNGLLAISVDARGRIALRSPDAGVTIPSLLAFEDVGDVGDLYTHSSLGAPLASAWFAGVRTLHHGPLRGTLEIRYRMRVPAATRVEPGTGDPFSRPVRRSGRHVELPLTVRVSLDADAPFVRLHVFGENLARDHRLRVVLRSGLASPSVLADAALGPVERRPIDVPADERVAERPPPTAPLHRWVSLSDGARGATIFSDGLAEYEATPSGDVAITLLRAVGELSRPDLPERPGHAGWAVSTPEAQSLGAFEAHLAFAVHGPHGAETADHIERLADDLLLPLRGDTLRAALVLPRPAGGVTLEGPGLAFGAVTPSDDGAWIVLRCVNLTSDVARGAWRFGLPVREARHARLDETPAEPIAVTPTDAEWLVPLVVEPHGVSTIVVR